MKKALLKWLQTPGCGCLVILVLLLALAMLLYWFVQSDLGCVAGCALLLLLLLVWYFLLPLLVKLSFQGWYKANQGKGPGTGQGLVVPPNFYQRPDPMIYAQYHLLSQGLPVTWDNPDIHLELDTEFVPSHELVEKTMYEVVARIWNGSTQAPVAHLPVRFSFLDFGIGTVSVPIGTTYVTLPVKGAPGHPAFARIPWEPPHAGHFCLQVELLWSDDANPANNLGQENTDVKPLNSPHAQFTFTVHNPTAAPQAIRLRADLYEIPPLPECDDERSVRAHKALLLAQHFDQQLVPPDWQVVIAPQEFPLAPGADQTVTVDVTAPDGFTGQQPINVHGFDGNKLVGGVTLYVKG